MARLAFSLFAFILLISGCASGSNINKGKHASAKSPDREYRINGKSVTEESFKDLLYFLIRLPGTGVNGETGRDGITGYDAEDKLGVVFEYRAVTEPGIIKFSLNEKKQADRK